LGRIRQHASRLIGFYNGVNIKHVMISVEQPQTKGRWIQELVEVLCAYRCTP